MPSMTPATRRALEFRSQPLRDRERRLRPTGIHRFGGFVQRCFHSFAAHQVGPGLAQTDDLGQFTVCRNELPRVLDIGVFRALSYRFVDQRFRGAVVPGHDRRFESCCKVALGVDGFVGYGLRRRR